jgi:hypothetical protein
MPPAWRHLALRILVIAALATVPCVANATPPESLQPPGLHDGGDYDSLVQPRVLAFAGTVEYPVPVLARLAPSFDRLQGVGLASVPDPIRPVVQPRAPPVR